MRKYILLLIGLLSGSACAAPTLRYTANFQRTDNSPQFHVYTAVLNTPDIQFSLYEGTNAYAPGAGWGGYLRYGKSVNDPYMATVGGSITGSTLYINAGTNDFPVAVDGWYAGVVLTSSTESVSARGLITIRPSPEISAPGILSRTYAINGSEYGPFTGDFSQWPFYTEGTIGEAVTNAVLNEGVSASPWSGFPATTDVTGVTGIQAGGSGGVTIKNSGGDTVASFGAGGGQGVTFSDGVNISGTLGGTGVLGGAIITNSQLATTGFVADAVSGLATGTPLYVETGTGTLIAASIANMATSGQWNASVAGASNLAVAGAASLSNNIRSGAIGVYTNITMAADIPGSGIGSAEWSYPVELRSFDGTDYDDLQIRGISVAGGEIWQFGNDGSYFVVVSNRNIPLALLTNVLASYSTTAQAGALYQPTNSNLSKLALNDAGSLTNVTASATNIPNWSTIVPTQAVDIAGNMITNVDVILSEGANSIDLNTGSFEGEWEFPVMPTVPGYLAVTGGVTSTGSTVTVTTNGSSINLEVDAVGAVTNIGFGLTGDGQATALAVDSNTIAVQGGTITGRWVAISNTIAGTATNAGWIGGGSGNIVSSQYSVISGGANNQAGGSQFSTIGGGSGNKSYGGANTIAGGQNNLTSNDYSTVGGGYENTASGNLSTVGGGIFNTAIGYYSTIPGGYNNTATTNAFAAGIGAKATNDGAIVFSAPGGTNSTFGSITTNEFAVKALGGTRILSPIFSIQLEDGTVVASFSTNSVVLNGTLTLSNIPSSILTVTQGNTNYARRTTVPASNTAAGSYNQWAMDNTNLYFYNSASSKWLKVNGVLEW